MGIDEELVSKVQSGDILAFEKIVKKYERPFYSFVFKITGEEFLIDDIIQDAFLKIYKNIDKIDIKRKFSTYAFEILKNTAISYLRKNKRRISIEKVEIAVDERNYDDLIENERRNVVKDALTKIEKKYRQIIGFYYFEELSYKEISAKTKLPINTVRTKLRRGKKLMRKVLQNAK